MRQGLSRLKFSFATAALLIAGKSSHAQSHFLPPAATITNACPDISISWEKEPPHETLLDVPIYRLDYHKLFAIEHIYKEHFKERCGRPWTPADGIGVLREHQRKFIIGIFRESGSMRPDHQLLQLADSIITSLNSKKPFSNTVPAAFAVASDEEETEHLLKPSLQNKDGKKLKIAGCTYIVFDGKNFSASEILKHLAGAGKMKIHFKVASTPEMLRIIFRDHERWHCLGKKEVEAEYGAIQMNTAWHGQPAKIAAQEIAYARLISAFLDYEKTEIVEKHGFKMYDSAMTALGAKHARLTDSEYNKLAAYMWSSGIMQQDCSYERTLDNLKKQMFIPESTNMQQAINELIAAMSYFKNGPTPAPHH